MSLWSSSVFIYNISCFKSVVENGVFATLLWWIIA